MEVLCQWRNETKTVNHLEQNRQLVIFHSTIALWPIRCEEKCFAAKMFMAKMLTEEVPRTEIKNPQSREMICQMNQFSGIRA